MSKVLLIMRLITIILITTILQVSAKTYGQKITLSERNAPLVEILNKINAQSGFDFLVSASILENSGPVSINVKNMNLNEVLEKLFEGRQLKYSIENKSVVVSKKEPGFLQRVVDQLQAIDVHGRVVDEKGNPLAGAIVKLKKGKRAVSANSNGEFVIQCTDEDEKVLFSFIGYITKELPAKAILANPLVKLEVDINKLDEVGIQSGKIIGTKVDMKHRQHQTLAQILEGGVPGLTLKSSTQTTTGETFVYTGAQKQTLEELYNEMIASPYNSWRTWFPTFEDYKQAVANGDSRTRTYSEEYKNGTRFTTKSQFRAKTSTMNTGIVPELRGASSYTGGSGSMLVVIDGFIQDGFPANYPMNNVASIEVIKDPVECLKWGARATGGVILITTNLAKPGTLQISYNSNFYFSPRPDISAEKLRLASSVELLDYYKEAYDKKIATYLPLDSISTTVMPAQLRPAEMLLFNLSTKKLKLNDFKRGWDSLARISNRDQLRLLQQNSFNQNHSISIAGGTNVYRFTLGGVYGTERSNSVGDLSRRFGLNLKNDLSLFKDKLKVKWIADVAAGKARIVNGETGAGLDPYQLLLGPQNQYVYEYNSLTYDKNEEMRNIGYFESGSNPLEDLKASKNFSKSMQINSSLNLDWKINRSFGWATSLRYSSSVSNLENLEGMGSSETRELINNYGVPLHNDSEDRDKVTGIDFYVPIGATYSKTRTKNYNYNIRSGFNFDHNFGPSHHITATIDGGLSNQENTGNPNVMLYGYNTVTDRGLPILSSVNSFITNYLGSSMNLNTLLVPGLSTRSYTRSMTLNGNLLYSYLNRYSLQGEYAASLVPDFGASPPYSTTSDRSVSGSWQVNKESFFNISWISNLKLSIKGSEIQVAKLPVNQISARLLLQPLWNNAAINIDKYNKTQQSGQKNQNLEGALEAGFSEERLQLKLSYNINSFGHKPQWNGRLFYDIAREPYFHFPLISSLQADLTLQDINPYQGLGIMMKSSSLSSGGGFSMPGSSDLGQLPPDIQNKEAHLLIGLNKDRFTLDLRYYRRTTAGLSSGTLPTDPSTGLSSQINYSKILNKGFEASLRAGIIQGNAFSWTVTLNGAYNINQAIDVPPVNFSFTSNYTMAYRNGYSTDNLWSFPWAGLDNHGDPQIYNTEMKKVSVTDSLFEQNSFALVYSGRTRAPWSGAIIQEWRYNGFFASARLMFNLGHVMRRYMPVLSATADKSIEIRNRWRKAGDEVFTDIAAVAKDNSTRRLIIQGSDNAILPADNVRLREIQFGYEVPPQALKNKFIKSLTISAQVQNVALWTRNKLHLDPEIVSNIGVVGITPPRNYIMSVNMSF